MGSLLTWPPHRRNGPGTVAISSVHLHSERTLVTLQSVLPLPGRS